MFVLAQVHGILDTSSPSHSANTELLQLLIKDRSSPAPYTTRQHIAYRQAAESAAGGEGNFYRIEWARERIYFQLLGRDEVTPEEEARVYTAWEKYMDDYISKDGTSPDGKGPWLRRCVFSSQRDKESL
jgi:histone deacetylase complex regulatory component SIN3